MAPTKFNNKKMTDQELKDIVASLAVSQKEITQIRKETEEILKQNTIKADKHQKKAQEEADKHQKKAQEEADKHQKKAQEEADKRKKEAQEEADKRRKETEEILKQNAIKADKRQKEAQEEADKRKVESDKLQEETKEILKQNAIQEGKRKIEADKLQEETRLQIKELGKQISGLGNKFGGFAEGMAFPSMEKIMLKDLGMEMFSTRVKRKIKSEGVFMEIDAMAYANSSQNQVYLIEVKSFLDKSALVQMDKMMEVFPKAFPEHKEKKVTGVLTYIDTFDTRVLTEAREKGYRIAHIHDELFDLEKLS